MLTGWTKNTKYMPINRLNTCKELLLDELDAVAIPSPFLIQRRPRLLRFTALLPLCDWPILRYGVVFDWSAAATAALIGGFPEPVLILVLREPRGDLHLGQLLRQARRAPANGSTHSTP
jgi:hypothetical protein